MNVETGTTLTFDRFWRFLREHSNCILRAGSEDVWLFDQEDLHWHFEEDSRHHPVVQLIQGKRMIAEMILDVRDVMFVQGTPEGEGEEESTLFEVVVGNKEETYTAYHFVLAHPFEEETPSHKGALKH
ncbi:MAG: hypothetical protein ACK4N5_15175 [Myxococcales bacterium]